jgi:glycine/D-amino acid oxidase-like deaminating enzyme
VTARSPQSVLVLGAGLAGLTAAYELSRRDYHVTLLDHHSWQDRFLSHPSAAAPVVLGGHHHTQRLLRAVKAGPSLPADVVIPVEFRLPHGRIVAYRPSPLPGALQWMASLIRFKGLTWSDRWKLVSYLDQVWEQAQPLPEDMDGRLADEWLDSIGQSRPARDSIWNPLAIWLTGNALTHLSAAVFAQAVSTVFLRRASEATLTHVQGSVGDRLIAPLRSALGRLGIVAQLQPDLPHLRFEQNAISDVRLDDGTLLKADWYLTALSHDRLLALLPERLLTRFAYFAHLTDLVGLSEVTVHLTSRSAATRPRLLLLSGSAFHQLAIGSPRPLESSYRLSAIGSTVLAGLSDSQLGELGKKELRHLRPEMGADRIHSIEIYHADNAALLLNPGTALRRPMQKSPIKNLLVAGAWTDTGWPANVESAIVSVHRCIETISRA